MRNDYIGPIGSYDLHFLSKAPSERKEYLTLLWPFDSYTWALLAASVFGVSASLILIDKLHAKWSRGYSTIFQSNLDIRDEINMKLFDNHTYSGISFSIGAILDEDHDYVFQHSTSYARSLIVSKWIVIGFLLTASYKSMLLAMMTTLSHEKTIDTIDDVLKSERKLWVPSDTNILMQLKTDPRRRYKELGERATPYTNGRMQWEDLKDVFLGCITNK